MSSDTRTPDEIERDIEMRRANLNSNLEDLQDRFSIDTMVRQIGEQFREHGGDIGRSVTEQVKANPIPLALTGIGLAWMMFGESRPAGSANGPYRSEDDYRRSRLDHGRPYVPPLSRASAGAANPSWARDDHDASKSSTPASSLAGSGSYPATNGRTASDGSSVSGALAETRDRISEGTETLTKEGRKRVIAARRKAVEMRRMGMDQLQHGSDAAADFYERQPLVAGALALAVGAALGEALPRTRIEDSAMGDHSDRLIEEAERIFEEERAKAGEVVRAVTEEVRDIATEAKSDLDGAAPGEKSAAEAIGERAKASVERVAQTAKTTTKDEELGKSNA